MTNVTKTQDEDRSTRDQILDAAERVVQGEGASRLTIDAVVKESGFSKGGVLYNFPSKTALIEGMIQRMAQTVQDDARRAAHADNQDCRVLTGLLEKLLDRDKEKKLVRMGLLAAIAQQPDLVKPIRDVIEQVHTEVEPHTSDRTMAHILFLAADGLRYSAMLGVDCLTETERDAVEARLLAMAKEISK